MDDSTTGPVLPSTFPLATKQQVNYEFHQDTDQRLPSILLRPLAFLLGEDRGLVLVASSTLILDEVIWWVST